jgi:hypothetical protein
MKKFIFRGSIPTPVVVFLLVLLLVLGRTFGLTAQSQLIENHFKTIGEHNLLQLQTACIKGRFVPLTREPTTFVAYLKFPDKIKIEWTQGRTRWTDVYANGKAYSRQGGVTTELQGQESFDLLWMLRSTSPLRNARSDGAKVSQEKWNSREYFKVEQGSDASRVEFLIDKTTNEIVLERIISVSDKGQALQEIKYLRYMDLGGVKVPAVFIMETEEGSADLIYDEVLLGYPLTDDFFK